MAIRVHPIDAPFSWGGLDPEGEKMARRDAYVCVNCEIKIQTLKAVCVVQDDGEFWIPLSQIKEMHDDHIICTEWIAKMKEGLEWEPM